MTKESLYGVRNAMNKGIRSDNTSGVTGVTKDNNGWTSKIGAYKKEIKLGYFSKFKDAVQTRKEAEKIYFGEYSPNHEVVAQ